MGKFRKLLNYRDEKEITKAVRVISLISEDIRCGFGPMKICFSQRVFKAHQNYQWANKALLPKFFRLLILSFFSLFIYIYINFILQIFILF